MAQFVTHIQPTLVEASHHHVPHQHHHKELHHHHKEYHETIDHHHKEHKDHKDHKDSHHHHKDSSHHHLRDFPVLPHPHVEHSPHNGHDDVDHKSKRDSGQYLDSHGVSHTFQLHFVDSQGIYRDYHGHAIDKDSEGRHKKEKSPFKDEAKAIPPQYIDLGGHYLDNKNTDGNTSFLRAARNGQLEKVLEHLESNIDINTSNANGLNALHLASKDGHVEIVKELLKRGAVIDAATKKGNTALHIASLAGQEEVVKLLVSHGASVNVQSQNGFTPLYMAAQENHDNVVKYLLANGANQSLSTEDGFTPLAVAMQQGHDKVVTVLLENDTRGKVRLPALHIAAKKDDVKAAKLLLENEHNPDVTSKSGFTPLHIASHYGNQAIANLLLQKGADVNYAAKHNITPLHVAAKWGKTNMVTVLLEHGANIESKTRDGLTPLHCAARSGHEQVVDMLLEKGAPISSKTKNGLAPLHMAAQGDHVDAARILLYHRAPVDEVTVDYLTALHVAAHCGHVRVAKLLLDRQADANARALNGFTPLHIACKKNRIKVVELLLKHGASIGATTESGLTPLHVASFMGCMNIVIYLLQHDASPDVPTVRGETPLHLAARANQTDIIRILLRNGAQVDARAREQQTPLHIASRLGNVDIVMLLLQHGAKVDNTTKDMYTALHIAAKEGQDEVAAALIDHGASLNATTKKGFTPLHLAAKYGHLKVAKLLLQKEAPVDAQGKNGVTPLHVASHYDHQNVALLLLEKGASPYATAKNGHTPLHIAAKKNQMDIANTLLEYGAKPNAESKAGFTPLHLSAQEGHCDMTDLLIEHKADTNHRARNGLAPLHLCAQEDKVPVAEILVKNGGEVDASTKNGYTPLHIACHYGQINMVRFLLSHGANVKANTALGYTPLHQAAQQGHTNIVNTLLENSAQPNAVTNNGQTPLHIAEKLGYITVIDTLKVVTQPSSPMSASTISNEEKYRVVAPEAMHETFMSDSEEEGAGENILDGFGTAPHQRHVYLPYFNGTTLLTREDTVLGDQTYRYLTADEMKSLGDDSLPIDVTRDERIDSNKMASNAENMMPPRHIEDNISPEHVQQNYVEYIKKYTPDNIDIDKHPINIGKLHWKNFLVSFLVDARGGAMRGCRHSGVRVIVPPRCASSPTRITCRFVRPQRTPHPPPLMEGEALASRVLELGPVGAKFLGPVIIEVPHFAALRGKEREIVILRSDNGESWKEHTVDATEEVLNEVLHDSFEAEDLNQLEDVSSGRITRIVTQDFPQYFAVVSRIRQEVHAIGPEGGMVSSTVVPQVQAVFPQGALTKKIKVGLQAQPIDPELTAKLLGHGVAVSPVVTVEPRRRKFHKAITLSMPAPRAHSQGMINQYSGSAPTLRLLCSITGVFRKRSLKGGTTRAQWEDVTGSTPLTFVNDCVSFTTTVSARFWLMDCRNVGDATKMATELYREAIHVPFMAKFVVFAKRVDPLEARLRVFCMTDDKEDKTLEHQEHFTEVAKSRDVEVLEGKPQYIEFAGNLVPITKSGEQLQFSFRAFRENRLPFSVRVKDQHAEAVSRCLFMREPKLPKGEPPQQPICILNIVLPDDIVVDTISLTDSDSLKKIENFDYYRPDPRLADMSNLLGEDWVSLATQLGLTTSEINVIKSEYPDSVAKQAQSMLRMWLSQSGNKAQTNTLESALRRIGREDIIPQCLNVEYPAHGIKEIGKQRLIKKISIEQNLYERDIMRDSESVESLKKAEEERKKENFDKYSAEEKVVEETSDEEDFNKTVTERRQQIEERLSVDRTVPASSQRVEIVQEISSIKRQSLVENKIAEVEQKAVTEVVDGKTTKTSNELTTPLTAEKTKVDGERERRDSALLEGVTQRFESTKTMMTKIASTEDPKSPKVSKTPPPSPADFLTREQAASIQEWDVSKKSASQEEAPQDAEQQETTATLTEDTKTVPQPKPRFAKEPPLQFKDREPKLEKQISPVRDDLLDEEDSAVPETYSDKKKFWENVTKEKRMSLNEVTTPDKEFLKKRVSVHEVPVPKPRSQVQVSQSIDETGPTKEAEEPETRIMSEYQASFQPPSERKSKTPPKLESDKESSTDSESDVHHSGTNENAGYISDSGDVEHYISDSEIEDRVPQIRERQMSVFAPPVAAVRKTIYERSASLPTEDLYEVSARSIKLRKQYYEEQIKKEMIEEQLTSELEEEPSPERKTLISSLVQQLSEEKITVRDIARSFDEATKKEVSFEDDRQTHIEDQTAISTQIHETHKEIDVDSQTKRSSVGSEQSSSSDVDKMTRNESTSKPDSMEVHVDKSEIEDSEKLAELDQDATDLETKSLDSLNAVEMSPKSTYSADEAIPEITVTLSGKQRRISEESDEYAPKTEKKTDLDSPIHVPEEHVEDTVWEVSVQSQPEARFDEKVTSFDAATVEKFEKEEDLSLSTRDESDLGSEIHQDHSDSYASDKIKSESHSDIERIILDSLHQQKVDPVEAKAIASALIEEIETEIQRRECLPPSAATGDVSDYLKYLAETKGLDEREVELVESVLARRQRELAKLSRGDTQASSIEITDEDLRYSGAEIDSTHLLEQQISQLKAEKFDDIKSMTFMDKIDEKHSEESHQSKDFETVEDGVVTGVKSDFHTKSFESVKGEKCETRDTIFEEDETISESGSQETQHVEAKVEAVATETLRKKSDEKEVDEYRASSIDVAKEKTSDVSTKKTEIDSDDSFKQKIEDTVATSDVTKSIIKHHIDVHEKSPTEDVKLKGEITCEDYLSKEERSKREATSEIKEIDGGTIEKEVAIEESHIKTIQKEFLDRETEEVRSDDTTTKQTKISSRVVSTDVVHESSSSSETKEQVEIIDLDPSQLPSELGEIKIIEKHEEIKRTSSSESKSSIESGKSPEDQFSTCSSGRKGDSDPSRVTDKSEVLMRKTSSLSKVDRKSGIDFETYSSSGESHYHSFELDSGKSRPCSSDVEGLVAAGSSEYESALTSQDYSCRSHITSTEYHTAVSSLSSKESMKSLDSESSGHLGSVEISELSETLVPSASDLEGDILDTGDQLDDGGWNEEIEDELSDKQSKMKRSHEMTFQPEPKLLSTESPQTEESDRKFTSMDDGSVVSMSLSSTSGTTEPRTVIELSRADSERVEGGSMTVSGISDQLSIEGSCDSLIFHQQTPLTTSDMSTSTGQVEGNLQIESITFTTSMVNESGIRSVSTQVTSESHTPEEDRAGKVTEPQPNGKCPPEMKKKCHRRQESTSSFVPPKMGSFEQKYQSELTESDKYTAELSFKEVISDEKKDIDEREKEESYETEADQGFHRDVREGKYQEAEEEIKDDTPEFSSETQASVGELEQEYSSAPARAQEVRKKSETSPDLNIHKEPLEKRDSHGKSSSTSSEKSSFEEAEAEAAFNMVAHVSPAHKIKQICPILEDEDAEKHELETRERAQKEYEKRRSQIRDQSPGSIPDIKVTQHMTPLVDRNFRYPDLELEEQERAKEKEKESETQKSTPQTPSSKSSEDTDQGREYVLEDSGISIPEEPKTESKSTVIEQTVKEEADKDTDSPNSDSFEMLEKPDVLDDFVVIEEVGKEAHEFDSEGKSVSIKQKTSKRPKKHDEEVEEYLAHSAPTPLTKMTDVKFYPDGSSSEELGFDFEDSPPINNEASASSYEKELEANKKWIEQQFQGDQAARMAAGYDYEMEFERGPLEDIKEEDINDFDPTSSRIGSLGSQKESGGSLGSVKDSYSSTPDYDVLAGRKYFTRSGEHDDISMSSLQEFENLERAMSLETKRYHQGSQDSSSNGSFKTRYYASKSGQGDDVSVSSLKEFEGLEMACIAAHKVEVKAKEEEAMLAQIDEGQESLASESESCETISRTDKKLIPDSDEEDYEKRMFEIDEIIRQAQSNVERFIDLKEGEKTESLGRGDSIEEVSKVPDLDLDAPVVRSTIKVQWKESEDVMVTSTDSIDGKIGEKGSQHDSTDSLDQKTGADIMTASTDSIEFQSRKTEPINLLSDSIEIRDEACGMVSSDSLELAAKQTENMLESTDSLVDPTSSTATHATYQYETDSVFSGSFTSGGSNTMVSSTDTIDPVQVDIAAAARKVWFDEDTATRRITTEFIQDSSKPYVTEVIEPTDEEGFSHTIHRRVELPPEIRKVTFHGSDADERLRQFIEDFNEGEHVEEVEEVDAAGNVHTKRIVQRRFIVEGPEMEKTVASKTNQLTSIPKETTGEESSFAATGGPKESSLKAQTSRRRQLRYEISVDDQIEVDPREHDWRFNLPEHAEGEESGTSGQQTGRTSQQRSVADQHQLSEEMKQLLKELEKESKQ
nr:PREDICTED: ankyrin-3 isoform X12 [Tribolium castaneum]|eukprot:XP_015834181.1 PREDICTED: ankyrin-3 isoform X12 [Tribolium castaneum]